jgi:hypothetical protein
MAINVCLGREREAARVVGRAAELLIQFGGGIAGTGALAQHAANASHTSTPRSAS